MVDFRRGIQAMRNANDKTPSKSGGFTRNIRWSKDGESKFIAFLTRADEIVTADFHQMVPIGTGKSKAGKDYTKYEEFIDRRDVSIGEDSDDLTDRLNHRPVRRSIAIAVELEPVTKTVNGRTRPVGFIVKTETFQNQEGEDIVAPLIGPIIQSESNFYGYLGSYDENFGNLEETPFQITRRGENKNTAYDIVPFGEQKIDYTPLLENLKGINYLQGESLDSLRDQYEVGTLYLNKRLNELIDKDRYDQLVFPIDNIPNKWGSYQEPNPNGNNAPAPTFDEMVPPKGSKFEQIEKAYANR